MSGLLATVVSDSVTQPNGREHRQAGLGDHNQLVKFLYVAGGAV